MAMMREQSILRGVFVLLVVVTLGIPFTGTFDGQGHKITGLTIKRSDYGSYRPYCFGLFGCTARGSRVRNLNMERVAVTDGDLYIGGLIAPLFPKGEVVGSFWDVQTSGQSSSAGGTGKTTAQMQTAKTFRDAAWDFTSLWDIEEGQSYPFLRPGLASDLNSDRKVDVRIMTAQWLDRHTVQTK